MQQQAAINIVETAHMEGMEKGRQAEKIDGAKSMLQEGLAIHLIQKVTGLSKDQLDNL
jgi:predicted transposase/invertase (TIGR01784 family)